MYFYIHSDQTLAEGSRWTSSPNVGVTEAVKPELTDYLIAPATPKRSSAHRNYKHQTHPILTAEERLQDLVLKENMKEEIIRLKKQKAEIRESKKLILEEEKRIRKENALKRRLEREEIQRLKLEAKKAKIEVKKSKPKPKKSTVPKTAINIVI